MADETRAFTFDLHESLYFEKGQEVAEMRGIALEPEISIQPYDEYISIRGIIELQGEYERAYAAEEEEQPLDLDNFYAKRYVERVYDEEGYSQFFHRFPVEISVPPYRVADLDEVRVTIESFDYEIVDPGHLKLSAKIGILGIDGELEEREEEEQLLEQPHDFPQVDESFSFEISKKKDSPAEVPLASRAYEEDESNEPAHSVEGEEGGLESGYEEEDAFRESDEQPPEASEGHEGETGITETGLADQEDTLPIRGESHQVESELEQGDQAAESVTSAEDATDDPDRWKTKSQSFSEFFHKQETVDLEEVEEDSQEIEVSEYASELDEEDRKEEVGFLSDMFRGEHEERYTKLRLCIVQNQDTLDTVAERFAVSPLQIIKQNQLEDNFEIHEGQLLYIPAK